MPATSRAQVGDANLQILQAIEHGSDRGRTDGIVYQRQLSFSPSG